MKEPFRAFAHKASLAVGSPWAFIAAVALLLAWAVSGPFFHFSDTWQLWANTGTTIVTFLMVFLIQNTQNRDARAIQTKLDELIRATDARNVVIDAEDLPDTRLDELIAEIRNARDNPA